jgi:hypothetical protein
MWRERRAGDVGDKAQASSSSMSTPGKHTLTEALPVQHKAASPVQRREDAGGSPDHVQQAAAHGLQGTAQQLPHLNTIQRAFGGHDVSGVRAFVGGPAADASRAMGAQAYATGDATAFAGPPDLHTAAHEAAHVVQQRAGVHLKGGVGEVGDSYEQHADAVADQVVQGRSAESLLDQFAPRSGASGAATQLAAIQRAVRTNGGEFDTTNYSVVSDGTGGGCDIDLTFRPNDLVETPVSAIGLTQTNTRVASPRGTEAPTDPGPGLVGQPVLTGRSLGANQGDPGRLIDRVEYAPDSAGGTSTLPTTNPMYGVHNTPANAAAGTAESASKTLTDTAPGGNASFGSRVRKPDGTFDVVPATLHDAPYTPLDGKQWRDTFETTALIMDGPMKDTYLGSVRWGWKADAAGTVSLDPASLQLVNAGAPSSDFMAAAQKWNDQTIKDTTTGTVHDTVNLPITTFDSGSIAAGDRRTEDLRARLDQVNAELAGMPAGVDRTNKEFEKRALEAELTRRGAGTPSPVVAVAGRTTADLVTSCTRLTAEIAALAAGPDRTAKETEKRDVEAELRTRNALVEVRVVSTEDWCGSDEVYVRLSSAGGGSHKTPVHSLNDGHRFVFVVPLASVLPLTGPLSVKVYDEDWPDGDDLIVDMAWAPPYGELHNSASLDDATYDVRVRFERG